MTGEPRDVEEIRADLAHERPDPSCGCVTPGCARCMADSAAFREWRDARKRLVADVEPLLARLAAADRENAELRGEVERLQRRLFPSQGESYANEVERQRVVIDTMRDAIASRTAERDDLRAQLAAAQAQLAEANGRAKALRGVIDRCTAHIREGMQLAADERDAGLEALVVGWTKYHGDQCAFKARLEAVRSLHQQLHGHCDADCPLDAALSAAPQPEPTHFEITVEGNGALSTRPAFQPEPPASDEPTGRSD